MKFDSSRVSMDAKRNVRTVTVQQGRVVSDADFCESSEVTLRRIETDTVDTLGPDAASVVTGGFKILPPSTSPAKPVRLSVGRLYVDGLQLENHAERRLPAFVGDGRKLIYLRASIDHITGVEAPVLRDSALGDADTCGRAIIRTDIGVLDVPPAEACGSVNVEFDALSAPSGGLMTVALTPVASSTDPCRITPDGGYSRPENLLYRCEVHGGAVMPGATDRFSLNGLKIKLSYNNASELAKITQVTGNRVTLASASRDGTPVFRRGGYAELLHEDAPYDTFATGPITRIDDVQGDVLVLAAPAGAIVNGRVRLWSQDTFALPTDRTIRVDGMEFTFSGNNFRRGDYWQVPARYVSADIDLTVAKNVPLPPAGPRVAYTRLGLLTVANGVVDPSSITDCRKLFAPLSQSVELEYAGGDGQSVMPLTGPKSNAKLPFLPSPLRAIVRIGHAPIVGAVVRFAIVQPAGTGGILKGYGISGTVTGPVIDVVTNAAGVAEVGWQLNGDPVNPAQRVTATLQTPAPPGQIATPPLHYSAQLSLASGVAYLPGPCASLQGETNVQNALDKLCEDMARLQRDFLVVASVTLIKPNREIDNNVGIRPEELVGGVAFRLSGPIRTRAVGFEPIARLTVEMPFPLGFDHADEWARRIIGNASDNHPLMFGTTPVHLSGTVTINGDTLSWIPSQKAQGFLAMARIRSAPGGNVTGHNFGINPIPPSRLKIEFDEPNVRGNMSLRGDSIWSEDDKSQRRYLNGEVLRNDDGTNRFSILPPGPAANISDKIARLKILADQQRAADFNLWFYFNMSEPPLTRGHDMSDVEVINRLEG